MTDQALARMYDPNFAVEDTENVRVIPVPGTDAVIEIDLTALAEQPATPEDFPFADSHGGDNYGKPTLRRG